MLAMAVAYRIYMVINSTRQLHQHRLSHMHDAIWTTEQHCVYSYTPNTLACVIFCCAVSLYLHVYNCSIKATIHRSSCLQSTTRSACGDLAITLQGNHKLASSMSYHELSINCTLTWSLGEMCSNHTQWISPNNRRDRRTNVVASLSPCMHQSHNHCSLMGAASIIVSAIGRKQVFHPKVSGSHNKIACHVTG